MLHCDVHGGSAAARHTDNQTHKAVSHTISQTCEITEEHRTQSTETSRAIPSSVVEPSLVRTRLVASSPVSGVVALARATSAAVLLLPEEARDLANGSLAAPFAYRHAVGHEQFISLYKLQAICTLPFSVALADYLVWCGSKPISGSLSISCSLSCSGSFSVLVACHSLLSLPLSGSLASSGSLCV